MAGRYVGFGKKLFDLAKGGGKSNVSTTITGVTPNVGTLKEFQKHKDEIIKSTDKYTKGLTDEGKIKVKGNVSSALSKLSKITKKKPVEKKAKGGRVGLKSGNGFPDLSGDGKTTFKDILIGRGVIKKGKKKTMMAKKSKTPMDKAVRKDKKKKRFV
tara:strand:- start:30 stop:500 length:471 start_codon:yes stop_codon:yes gene_type:complete